MSAPEDSWDPAPAAPEGGSGGRTPSPARRSGRSRSPERRPMDVDERRNGNGGGDRGRQPNPGNNLHVSGLSSKVEEPDLEGLFGKYGRVQKAQVMRDPHTKDPRGFAFVTMETAEEADAAVAALNATELMGKIISIERARRGRARTPTPGTYHGPPKKTDFGPPGGGGGRGGYERRGRYEDDRYDRRPPPRDYGRDDYRRDDRRGGYDTYAAPMRDDRRGGGYDDRRGGYERGGYDDRRGGRDEYYSRERY